jgi:hypothetical protein
MVAIVLAIGGVALAWSIDGLLAKGIQHGGTYALGVPVTTGTAGIGLTSGRLSVGDLRVANPSGFSGDPFLAMGRLETLVPVADLMKDTIEIPKVELAGIRVSLEQSLAQSNWSVITDNLRKFESGEKKPEEAGGRRFVIRELVLSDVKVGVALVPIPGKALKREIELPTTRLRDIGADGGKGALIGEVASVVVRAILGAVAEHGGGVLPSQTAADLSGRVKGLIDLGVQGGAGQGHSIRDLRTDPARAMQGLEGLLGGKKK